MSSAEHDCDGPARVYIHKGQKRTRLPLINDGVITRVTTDGPTDITRYSEVHFPAEGIDGTPYARLFKPIEADRSVARDGVPITEVPRNALPTMGEVQIRDSVTDEYVTVHRGVVTGVGGSSGSANEMRLQIRDPNVYLDLAAEFAVSEGQGVGVTALKKTANAMEDNNPVFLAIPLQSLLSPDSVTADSPSNPIFGPIEFGVDVILNGFKTKTFVPNRDTFADVVSWVRENTDVNVKIWFEPFTTDEGFRTVSLVVASDAERKFRSQGFDPDPDSEFTDARETSLFKNDALFEISPVNAVYARGSNDLTSFEIAGFEAQLPGVTKDEYPFALVQHDPTVARAGQRVTKTIAVSGNDKAQAKNEARQELANLIEESGRGTMYAEMSPNLRPYDILRAVPVCRGQTPEVEPVTYQITGVVHDVGAPRSYSGNDDVSQPHTQIKVRPDARSETFTVVEEGTKSIQDSDSDDTGLPDFPEGLELPSLPGAGGF